MVTTSPAMAIVSFVAVASTAFLAAMVLSMAAMGFAVTAVATVLSSATVFEAVDATDLEL